MQLQYAAMLHALYISLLVCFSDDRHLKQFREAVSHFLAGGFESGLLLRTS